MIYKWTTWSLDDGIDSLTLQISLTILDPATWEPLRQITKPVGPERTLEGVRSSLRSDMEEWIAVYGLQLTLL